MSKDKKEKFKMEISLKTLDFCRDLIWICRWAYLCFVHCEQWKCMCDCEIVYAPIPYHHQLSCWIFSGIVIKMHHTHIFITAILAGNDTFLTENITQDRKRSKTYILIKEKVSEGWWSAFVISAKKKSFPSWAGSIMIPFLCILVPKNNF